MGKKLISIGIRSDPLRPRFQNAKHGSSKCEIMKSKTQSEWNMWKSGMPILVSWQTQHSMITAAGRPASLAWAWPRPGLGLAWAGPGQALDILAGRPAGCPRPVRRLGICPGQAQARSTPGPGQAQARLAGRPAAVIMECWVCHDIRIGIPQIKI